MSRTRAKTASTAPESGASTATLLIEIGTEELPPKALRTLSLALRDGVAEGLEHEGIAAVEARALASPRRLAVLARGVPLRQADQRQERKGPALGAAFDADGKPTRAAEGFARSCGVSVDELERRETDKGEWLVYRAVHPGRAAQEIVPEVLNRALARLPVPKRMRWADLDTEFVRPVHWVVLMLDGHTVAAEVLGLTAGNSTRGHRFHAPAALTIADAGDYERLLLEQGHVIVDFERRRERIREQVEQHARDLGAKALGTDALLDEVTALVEWTVAVVGEFEEEYLRVPPEALISTMRGNQKYFPLSDADGRLLARFITISNLDSREPERVRAGNERVVRPRLADAAFFWDTDRKQPLEARAAGLAGIVFQRELGTLQAKSERVAALAASLAPGTGAEADALQRAAVLAKCDLLTEMVGEFPELQGTMGRYYALHDGEAEDVALALEEQYLPRFAGDALPGSAIGRALALAERLDTLAGIFAIGQKPSGVRDPYGLRRAALGVLRILVEHDLPLDLLALLREAVAAQPVSAPDDLAEQIFDFMMERLRAYSLDDTVGAAHFDAVLARRPVQPADFHRRLQAVVAFSALPQASSLAAANKRIRNILRQAPEMQQPVSEQALREPAEQALYEALLAAEGEAAPRLSEQDYTGALAGMAALREPVDEFFEHVLVMAEDPGLRANRIALLARLSALFLEVADIGLLPAAEVRA